MGTLVLQDFEGNRESESWKIQARFSVQNYVQMRGGCDFSYYIILNKYCQDSGSSRRLVGAGSSPVSRTIKVSKTSCFRDFFFVSKNMNLAAESANLTPA